MSTEESRRIVMQAYAAFGGRRIEELLALVAEDVEWGSHGPTILPTAGVRLGHAGVIEWMTLGSEAEDIRSMAPSKFIADGEEVAVTGRAVVVVRSTGKQYETDFVHLVTLRGGKIVRFQELFDTAAAAEAYRS